MTSTPAPSSVSQWCCVQLCREREQLIQWLLSITRSVQTHRTRMAEYEQRKEQLLAEHQQQLALYQRKKQAFAEPPVQPAPPTPADTIGFAINMDEAPSIPLPRRSSVSGTRPSPASSGTPTAPSPSSASASSASASTSAGAGSGLTAIGMSLEEILSRAKAIREDNEKLLSGKKSVATSSGTVASRSKPTAAAAASPAKPVYASASAFSSMLRKPTRPTPASKPKPKPKPAAQPVASKQKPATAATTTTTTTTPSPAASKPPAPKQAPSSEPVAAKRAPPLPPPPAPPSIPPPPEPPLVPSFRFPPSYASVRDQFASTAAALQAASDSRLLASTASGLDMSRVAVHARDFLRSLSQLSAAAPAAAAIPASDATYRVQQHAEAVLASLMPTDADQEPEEDASGCLLHPFFEATRATPSLLSAPAAPATANDAKGVSLNQRYLYAYETQTEKRARLERERTAPPPPPPVRVLPRSEQVLQFERDKSQLAVDSALSHTLELVRAHAQRIAPLRTSHLLSPSFSAEQHSVLTDSQKTLAASLEREWSLAQFFRLFALCETLLTDAAGPDLHFRRFPAFVRKTNP